MTQETQTGEHLGTDTYPAQGSEETSKAAYRSIDDVRGKLRREVYNVVVDRARRGLIGATQDDIGCDLDRPPNTIWPRMKELERDGFIYKGPYRRPTRSGRKAIVWEPVSETP